MPSLFAGVSLNPNDHGSIQPTSAVPGVSVEGLVGANLQAIRDSLSGGHSGQEGHGLPDKTLPTRTGKEASAR